MNNPPDGDAIPRSYSLSSKSPDLAGDLPIFDIVMTISWSPDLEWKSPDLLQETQG